ncbi:MAG: class I SAM-dependent methyltransferase [Myxococcales bacterium]|nr:class I SAM-dependent methyltransferase [Myxococcales bacterium]
MPFSSPLPSAWSPSPLTDEEFDGLLPEALWKVAPVHFTPVAVAALAVRLLAPAAGARVLDVGAGVGKFCIAAALYYPQATFVGVERRPTLVATAREVARQLGARNVEFMVGDALDLDWADYGGLYLFNPYGEQSHDGAAPLDPADGRDPAAFFAQVRATRERLLALPTGRRVVTYHGYGNRAPAAFDVLQVDHATGPLERWTRR